MTEWITGDRALDRKLQEVGDKVARKAMVSGIRAGMNVIQKAIKANVSNSRVRKVVGSRFKRRNKKHDTQAKVGASVGKQTTVTETERRSRPGVGISKQNAHYYFLGTSVRYTKDGARRGSMPNNNAVVVGYAQAKPTALAAIHKKIRATIEREVSKMKGSR